jgi:CRP-like cAMP-binding protein
MADSDKKLAMHRKFKSRIEQKIFENILAWSEEDAGDAPGAKRMSLIERSFHSFDPHGKGYIDAKDLRRITKDASAESVDEDTGKLTLSQFEELISSSMRNKYFPKGHIIFREGDVGNAMYVINSGIIEVTTKDGFKTTLSHGEFIGEGSLLDAKKRRSASCRCVTPVHVIEISRDYFNKYLAGTDMNVSLNLRERSKSRKRHRAKSSLRLQQNMEEKTFQKGEYLYKEGEQGDNLYILERGKINVVVQDQTVFGLKPGDMCGEHALITGRKRNSSAVCTSDECVVLAMKARDFNAFLKKSPNVKDSMYDICMRRELQKAIVFKTKKAFPQDNADLRAAFEAADEDDSGKISLDNVRTMLLRMDPTISSTDMKHVLKSLDLDESGDVKWEEFQRILQANKD